MKPLVIKLSGSIDTSNFNEWQQELIVQIHSVNKELVTEDDFAIATRQVKQFKSAENLLKQAKQSAIEQADDIQKLFATIDEVTEEARQARLSLDRQIKVRKQEIKEDAIQSGIDETQQFLDEQIDEFRFIDHSAFLDRHRFESAIRGKAGLNGLIIAINSLCRQIREEIVSRAIELDNNKTKMDSLSEQYKLLFQDRKSLLALRENELELEIDKRIARYNEQNARQEAEQKSQKLKQFEELELNPELHPTNTEEQKFQISIELLSTKDKAIDLARIIKKHYADNPLVSEIRLRASHE